MIFKKIIFTILTGFIVSLTASHPCFAADFPDSIKIKLAVSASEEYLTDRLVKHLRREFDYIGDAAMVYDGEDWKIAVVASKTASRGGQRGYYSFSVLYLKPSVYRDLYHIEDHILIDGQPDLESGARSIAVYFEEHCLGREVKNRFRRY